MKLKNLFSKIFSTSRSKSLEGGGSWRSFSQFFSRSFFAKNDYEKAYKGWVSSCVSVIASNAAMLETSLFKRNLNGDIEQVFSSEADQLLGKMNDQYTRFQMYLLMFSFLEIFGNAYWWIPKGKNEILPLSPKTTFFKLTKETIPKIASWHTVIERPNSSPSRITIPPEEVIHFKKFNPFANPMIPHYGMGTVATALASIELDESSNNWNNKFFKNSARPDTALEIDGELDSDQRERIKKEWENAHRGTKNSHKITILENGAKINMLGISQKEMDFVKQKELSRDEILAFFHTPKDMIGMVANSNRATIQGSREIFALSKINPVMKDFVDTLNEFFLPMIAPGQDLFFKYKTPVPEDATFKLEKNKFDIANGIRTPNEIRAQDGLAPYKGGDNFYIPSSFVENGELKNSKSGGKKHYLIHKSKHLLINVKDQKNLKSEIIGKLDFSKVTKALSAPKKKVKKYEKANDEELKVIAKEFLEMSDAEIEKFQSMTIEQFDDQEKRVLKNLKKSFKSFSKKELIDEIFNFEKEQEIFTKNSLSTYFLIYKNGANDALKKIGSEEEFRFNNRIIKKITKRASQFFGGEVNKTTEKDLAKQLSEGATNDEGIDQIAERVKGVYSKATTSRAETIARTETLNAINDSQLQVYNDDETVEKVQWVSATDERTRGDHLALNGKTIKKGKKFNLSGYKIDRPQDSILPAGESINCRCSLIGIIK